jgi:predicted PurR-regulated permease PerM
MAPDDIHKTSANTSLPVLSETGPEPVKVVLDPSTPSVTSITRVVIVALILVFIAGFLASIISSLTYLFFLLVLSIFFAYLIWPLVRIIRRPFKGGKFEKLMPRPLAILISYAIVFTTLGFGISSLAPIVSRQSADFAANLPAVAAGIRDSFADINRRFDRLRVPEDVQTRINEQAVVFGEYITAFFGGFLLSLVIYLPWLLLVPILAFFFLKDVDTVRLTVLRVFPAGAWRFRANAVLEDVNTTLAAYTRAQIISCLLIGTICTIGFWAIGLNYAILLGILAGVFEFVPLLGPAAIGILVTTTAGFSARPWNALYVFIFLVVLRVVHDYFTYPRIVRGGLHLHPLLIIISVLAGEQVAGIPGVFLAIPIVAILTVLYKHVLEHRQSTGMVKELLHEPAVVAEEAPTT